MKRALKVSLLLLVPTIPAAQVPVRYARDVLPILSANCFSCHGPDEKARMAGLRLDIEGDAKAKRPRGFAIAPGQPEQSLILARVTSDDPNFVMPPPDSHRKVTRQQIETLRRWVAEGAKWSRHWSFEPVIRPAITRGRHPIDALVGETLAKKGLSLRPPAPPQTLVRRLWLDLTGLPPTPEIADSFAANPSTRAYEKMVDTLLASPRFGEHWARMWLDLARYADTKGYEKDLGRTMWPYRDWVVNALNADMTLDRFTREQLAGDLLPSPTESQLIATAFHRNTMNNDEGGTDNEEFRVAAVKDRVDTTAQVWMGLTIGCAKCHTHKYDPVSQSEYYSFYALFNQTQDDDRFDDAPTLELLSEMEREERKRLGQRIETLRSELTPLEEALEKAPEERTWRIPSVVEAVSKDGATLTVRDGGGVAVSGKAPPEDTYIVTLALQAGRHMTLRLEAIPERTNNGQLAVGRNGVTSNFVVSELAVELLGLSGSRSLRLRDARASFANDKGAVTAAIDGDEKTGWSVAPYTHERHTALFNFDAPLELTREAKLRVTISQQAGDSTTLRHFKLSTGGDDAARMQPASPSPQLRKLRDDLAIAYQAQKTFNENIVRLPLMRELAADKRRETRIHQRGNFLDPGDAVAPGVPGVFKDFFGSAPLNRLGVAEWLVNRNNPLTPRVWANRVWSRLFGIGIVETEEDFGAQGSQPSNPELLDWLAAEYRDRGWSLKSLLKTIVLSETYKQASSVTPQLRNADPRNRMHSRGARFRLSAESVRDQALAVAGLLSNKMGGPPVMPPQPPGLWRSTYSGKAWVDAEGEDRFRRGLYTYLKRTTPYPSMITFDSGSGEVCQMRRIRTNTPLQALVTLNDPVYLEAAAGLARRIVTEADSTRARAAHGLRLALIRPLREGETGPLIRLQHDSERSFGAAPLTADKLLKSTRAKVPPGISKAAFAAWIVTANAILNLDEFLTRN